MNKHSHYQASAPGSIMLFGEHAVLRNKYCLVAAVNKRIKVTLKPRVDQAIHIESQLGRYNTDITTLNNASHSKQIDQLPKKFSFVLASIMDYLAHLPSGFDLSITAEFSHQVGLGSSAAVVVAVLSCLAQFCQQTNQPAIDQQQLLLQARQIIRSIQGSGSGADIAASIYGGIVLYRPDPLAIEQLSSLPKLSLIYAGYKTPTPEVIARVNQQVQTDPAKYHAIFAEMETCVLQAKHALCNTNWLLLGQIMQQHQQLQQQLGTSDATLDTIIQQLLQQESIYGAKISGSGLGDCVVALGFLKAEQRQTMTVGEFIPIELSLKGVNCG